MLLHFVKVLYPRMIHGCYTKQRKTCSSHIRIKTTQTVSGRPPDRARHSDEFVALALASVVSFWWEREAVGSRTLRVRGTVYT